jgi:hypothetical protein
MTEVDAARERLLAGLAMAERYNADRIEFGEGGDAISFDDIRTILNALSEKVEVVEHPTIEPLLVDWLTERGLMPDADPDGTVDFFDIIQALNDHENELLSHTGGGDE